MALKQSFCYPLFQQDGTDLDNLFSTAAAIGYSATELWGRDEHLPTFVACARRHGLSVASMCGHDSIANGLNDPAEHDRIEQELRASIDVAVAHDIPGLIVFAGNRRPGLTDEQAVEVVAEGLRRVVDYAEACGINLNLELLNSRIDHPGYQGDHSCWGVAVCEAVDSPRVKLLYDIYHMQIMEGDVIRSIRTHSQWIGHFHTAGNPGRRDLDAQQELNYSAICRAIAATGYDLYLGHEFSPQGDPFAALATAYDTCNVEDF